MFASLNSFHQVDQNRSSMEWNTRAQPKTLCTHFQYEALPTSSSLSLLFAIFVPTSSVAVFLLFLRVWHTIFGFYFPLFQPASHCRWQNSHHWYSSMCYLAAGCTLIPSRKLYIYCRKSGSYFVSQKFITNIFCSLVSMDISFRCG